MAVHSGPLLRSRIIDPTLKNIYFSYNNSASSEYQIASNYFCIQASHFDLSLSTKSVFSGPSIGSFHNFRVQNYKWFWSKSPVLLIWATLILYFSLHSNICWLLWFFSVQRSNQSAWTRKIVKHADPIFLYFQFKISSIKHSLYSIRNKDYSFINHYARKSISDFLASNDFQMFKCIVHKFFSGPFPHKFTILSLMKC